MDGRPNFDFSKFAPQKVGKGHIVKTSIYVFMLVVLVVVIFWTLTRKITQHDTNHPAVVTDVIENVKIEVVDSTGK